MIMLFVLLLPYSLSATEHGTDTGTVKQLITAVKKAPIEKRRVLMNRLKLKLRSTQQATRNKVMMDLRQAFHSHVSIKSEHPGTHTMKHTGMCESKEMYQRKHKDNGKKDKPKPPKKHGR